MQLLGRSEAHGGIVIEQLMAGHGESDQAAQAVVQAQFAWRAVGFGSAIGGLPGAVLFDEGAFVGIAADAALLQGLQQWHTLGAGRGGPVLQQFGLLAGVGSDEIVGLASLRRQWQQQQQAQENSGKGSGHKGVLDGL